MAAAVNGAAEAGLNAFLTINPDHFGTTDNDGVFDTAELVTNLTGMNTADITAMDGTSFTDFA